MTPLQRFSAPALTEGSPGCPSRGWPRRIGVLNDYLRIPYANGSSFASQFLYRELTLRGHSVTVIGPRDPHSRPDQLPERYAEMPSLPLKNHPGVYLPLPAPAALEDIVLRKLELVIGQTGSELAVLGTWLRRAHKIPFLCVNTIHLPSVYNVILPDRLNGDERIRGLFDQRVVPWLERHSAEIYNQSDGLIVLSDGLERYWRKRGVSVPIHVIPRSVDPKIFDVTRPADPFSRAAKPGSRLIVVCRHTREKNVVRLLEICARFIMPAFPDVTLTLVGDGPDHDAFRQCARRLGIAGRCFFPGEYSISDMPNWYHHADLFVYTSLSETYGQVVSEALWCGLPVVAFKDEMGVSQQVEHTLNGALVAPGPDPEVADWRFASEVAALLRDAPRRHRVGSTARQLARLRSDPELCIERYYAAFEAAARHCRENPAPAPQIGDAFAFLRWTAIHGTLAALGCVRTPAVVNRHGRSRLDWRPLDHARQRDRAADAELADPKARRRIA